MVKQNILLVVIFVGLLMVISGGEVGATDPVVYYGYTHVQPDGNRYALGQGSVPVVEPLDIALGGEPAWVVGAPTGEVSVSIWVVALADGTVQSFRVEAGRAVEPIAIEPQFLPPGIPPLLQVVDGEPSLVIAPIDDASPLTHPVILPDGRMALINQTGDIVLLDKAGQVESMLGVDALPDARLVQDGQGGLRFLSAPTDVYGHGVLGDAWEAQDVGLVDVVENGTTSGGIVVAYQPGQVIEGTAPIWTDLDGDGVRDLIVTVSDAEIGARIRILVGATGAMVDGPAIGQGYRWRHQIAVAPFGPHAELELVDVLTPHIGGVVEFYQLKAGELVIVDRIGGFTSHVIGTRNLDMAAAGDFDSDGRVEVLLPDQARLNLGGIRHEEDGAAVVWRVPIGGQMTTNLGVVTLPDDQLAVGVGRDDGVLRLWLPE